ncbi:MAG: CHAT domain-containing protein [Calothrix sp. MO_167.B12]|nr:CHAT domain-containing protein [Calothrix sp. MO_167.B12]
MLFQKMKITRKVKFFLQKIYKKGGAFLLVCLFLISSALPVIAKISVPTPTVQSQSGNEQQVKRAIELYRSGQFSEAVTAWSKVAKFFAGRGDKLNQAMALSNLSLSYQQLQQWEEAKKVINQSIEILKVQPTSKEKQKILAESWDIQGLLQRETGQSSDALKSWQQSTKIYSQLKDADKVAQSQINQSQVMQDLGLHPRACKTILGVLNDYLQVGSCEELRKLNINNNNENQSEKNNTELEKRLQKAKASTTPYTTALGLRSLGETLRFIGELGQSQLVLQTSIDMFKQLNNPQEQVASYLSLGNTFKTLADGEIILDLREDYKVEALSAYDQVIQLSPSPIIRQQAQLNKLGLLLKRKEIPAENLSAAQNIWASVQPQIQNLSPSRTGVYMQINLARSLVKLLDKNNSQVKANSQLPDFNDTEKILVQAINQAKTIGDKRAEAYGWGYRGQLYELSGNNQTLSQAEKFTKQSLATISSLDAPEVSYLFFWQLGRIRKQQGDIKDAIAAYTKSYDALQALRGDLVAVNPELRFSFRDTVEPVYRQLVELDLEYASSLQSANNKAVKDKDEEVQEFLGQARDVIESLQLSELNNFFREVCADEKPQDIDRLDKQAAVIYPIILNNKVGSPDKLQVLLSLPNKQPIKLYTPKITDNDFENTLDRVRRSLLDAESQVSGFLPEYQKVYNWLIEPLEDDLENAKVKTLVFVLDGKLRNIPMAVLHNGKNFLIEEYAIAIAPGLRLVNPKPIAGVDFKVLTAGLSQTRTDFPVHEGFPDLENVPTELRKIRELGLTKKILLNDQFTTKSVRDAIVASRLPIVHLATHGQFSSNEEKTFILSWDKRIDIKELNTLLQDNTLIPPQPIELLVLSACETASGDNRAALGLAGVAVRAGTRSTLATLWSVVDESTATLMGEFYTHLKTAKKTKINKAQALQKAQLALIRGKNEAFRHPHFWAPFVMVGNWQ